MMEKENDIYISYRRDDGWQYAVALQGMLSQQGYRTYYQVERWSSGRCDEETYNAIQSSSVIVMLLTPGYIGGLCIECTKYHIYYFILAMNDKLY